MIVGIAIDDWKLSIFEGHLSEAGYKYTKHHGLLPHTLLLNVMCASAKDLEPVVRAANAAARGTP